MLLAEDLKKSVLQYAMQGKMTKQLSTDSSVETLCKKICEEKGVKSFANILSDDIPFDIPASWVWCKIADVIIKDIGGGTPSKVVSEYWGGDIPWMSVKDFSNAENGIIIDTIDHITQSGVENSSTNVIDTDAIIICTRMGLGKYAKLANPTAINQDLRAIWLSKNINERYFVYFYSSLRIKGAGTTVKGIKKDELMNYMFPLPPVEEQQRIVDKLDVLMKEIDEYELLEKQLETIQKLFPTDMRNAVLQYAMQGKMTKQLSMDSSVEVLLDCIRKDKQLRISKGEVKNDKRLFFDGVIEPPYDIPQNWKWTTLGNLLYKLTDGTHRTPKYTSSGIKFISVKDMSSGKLSLEHTKFISEEEHKELYARCNPEKGDMLLSKVGTTGVPAIIDTDEEFSLFVSVGLLKYNHDYVYQEFLYYLLQSPVVQQQASENTKGIGNKNWVLDKIASTVVPLPPIEEQQRIVERLEQILPLIDDLK